MTLPFSVHARELLVEQLRTTTYDLIIIGGGITGAGIALDAASRGLSVALLEKNDFAFGTSSRSTKLVHGGLRYLKQLEFGLVREVGSERAVVHRLAPHLVVPEKMLLPLYEKKGLGYWITSLGLMVYDFLANVRRNDQRRMLTRAQTLRKEPLLKKDGVRGGAIYAEYRTDDARLTLEILKTAARYGAHVSNYTRVTGMLYEKSRAAGVSVTDETTGLEYHITGTVVVNATGPWVDGLREMDNSLHGKKLHLTKGVHIVFPREKFPVRQAIYFDIEDGRMIFAIPRGRTTYVGTTDTNYTGDKDQVHTTREDADYLVRGINSTFEGINLSVSDIESSWAGLRPLIHEDGKSESELSRKDEIFISASGLISIAGGKLTGYRKMAERVVDTVVRQFFSSRTIKRCHTATLPLTPEPLPNRRRLRIYLARVQNTLKPFGLDAAIAANLVEIYGKQADRILHTFLKHDPETHPQLALLKAQAAFGIQHEMVVHLDDFFVRRTGLLYFDIHKVIAAKESIGRFFQDRLGWTDDELAAEMERMEALITGATQCTAVTGNVPHHA